ncbi:ABC transporter ATP-binding protein [Microvirga zambiensis]|uniref:ABC transporter ATP-binding protein n=1 Tax=Microvirga zambiensis TaxID=1402137 RepID=UPI00191DD2D4|nr:ABC transporter ATP-binding protein [Microvirga zambiensis]
MAAQAIKSAYDGASPAISPRKVLLQAVDLCHGYEARGEKVVALDNVNLTIHEGDFVTVVGPSGCGKSTLARIFAGLTMPSSGQALYDGKLIQGASKERGMVFQELAILPWRTVAGNIAHGLEIAGTPKAERARRVAELVSLIGLEGFEDKYPRELSGGMRQRVAVARTWATKPPVILMDEPFAAVDAITRITLQEELIRLTHATNRTVVFITHSVEEAVFLGDYVVAMTARPGRVLEIVPIPPMGSERTWEDMIKDPRIEAISAHVFELVRGRKAPTARNEGH